METQETKRRAYVVVFSKEPCKGYEIGLAIENEKGYFPGYGEIDEGLNYDQACDVVDGYNAKIFGLTPKEASAIVLSTMRK